ncbi:MAG: helix-turn-helix domain-containing protein [Hyphomicrobiaceae bacterium]
MRDTLRSPQQKQLRTLLRELRSRHQLTQAEVAKRLAKPQSFVAKYERGERRLSAIEFIHVARAIGVEPVALLRQVIDIVDRGER